MKTAKQIKSAIKRSIKKVSTAQSISNNDATQMFFKLRQSLENYMDSVRYVEDSKLRDELNQGFSDFLALGQQWIADCTEYHQGALSSRVSIINAEKKANNAKRIWQPL